MSKRPRIFLIGAVVVLSAGYVTIPFVIERWLTPPELEHRGSLAGGYSLENKTGMAPVQIWWEEPLDEKNSLRSKKAERLLVNKGQAFVGDTLLRTEEIKDYLNLRVQSGEIRYVIIFPVRESRLGEIIPVIDECRKSQVQVVLLNFFES